MIIDLTGILLKMLATMSFRIVFIQIWTHVIPLFALYSISIHQMNGSSCMKAKLKLHTPKKSSLKKNRTDNKLNKTKKQTKNEREKKKKTGIKNEDANKCFNNYLVQMLGFSVIRTRFILQPNKFRYQLRPKDAIETECDAKGEPN